MMQRERMLAAVVAIVAEKGYADMTVGDIVARAAVSRRTFYEQFHDKLEAFIAAYEERADSLIDEIEQRVAALDADADRRARLRAGLEAYAERLAAEPTFARVLTIDVLGAGPRALEARERVLTRFADQYRALSPDSEALRALVGGIGELVQARVLAGDAESLPELVPTFERLVLAFTQERRQAWVA